MSLSVGVFNNLRQKLDVLGYNQTLPLTAIPLVGAIFEDLVKSTENLRDAKQQIADLLEEKSCWELGAEPYKCDNSRLLAENCQLHDKILKEREEFEQRICELNQKLRSIQADKQHLTEHNQQLQQQITFLTKEVLSNSKITSGNMKNSKDNTNKQKKPFITTVRSGDQFSSYTPLTDNLCNLRCAKCNSGRNLQSETNIAANASTQLDMEKLERNLTDVTEQMAFYKRMVEARDREIQRLSELLKGGRPPVALAKDCCYRDVKVLSEDINILQREKSESLSKIRDCRNEMHEAMQRAIHLETYNKQLQQELDELKDAALQIEKQANNEIAYRDGEIEEMRKKLNELKNKNENSMASSSKTQCKTDVNGSEKLRFNERINELTQRETEMKIENEHLLKKVGKLKSKIVCLQKELKEYEQNKEKYMDEEKIRLQSERDFFQKEYLRLLNKTGSEQEINFLQSQIKSKDDELRILRSELCTHKPIQSSHMNSILPSENPSLCSNRTERSDCVQAVVLRAERERDCVRSELERVKCERDALHEKHISLIKSHADAAQRANQHIAELQERLKECERKNHELDSVRRPNETHVVLLKEEIDDLKKRLYTLQEENCKANTKYNQLKLLHDQTERLLIEYQNKLSIAEHRIQNTDSYMTTLDSNREEFAKEAAQLRTEVAALKHTYVTLEFEKDKIVSQLDEKTERAYKLEYELKSCKEKCNMLEKQVKDLEEQLEKLSIKTRKRDAELHETSSESKTLYQQLTALKTSREQAIAEHANLTNKLSDSQAENALLKRKLKDSEKEVDTLKQQLQQYVQEVKKAEDLLAHKENEREEMLEHYRSLSHDAITLEGNNQSLEHEAAEYKRQLHELEEENESLKKEICCRNSIIQQLEDKISAQNSQIHCLTNQLDEAIDDQRLLKVDLSARKELCDKLDIEKDKLNAELGEINRIRQKLERDNESLREEIERIKNSTKVPSETLEGLLTKTRHDLEEQIKIDTKLSQELVRLQKRNDELLKQLNTEREKCQQQQVLAHEYQVQNEELRHNLTDDRFRQARSREQSPHYSTKTM